MMTKIVITTYVLVILTLCPVDAPGGPFCRKGDLPPSINQRQIRWARAGGDGPSIPVYCKPEYMPSGRKVYVRCVLNGTEATWTGPRPPCRLITCTLPVNPGGGGHVKVTGGGRVGSRAFYTCPVGRKYTGSNPRVCQRNGQFDGSVGSCTSNCPNPTLPDDLNVVYNDGETIRLSCDVQNKVYTGTDLICKSRIWLGYVGQCVSKDTIACKVPLVENAVIRNKSKLAYGEVYRVECEDGFEHTGTELKCLANSTLFGISGECRPLLLSEETTITRDNSTLNASCGQATALHVIIRSLIGTIIVLALTVCGLFFQLHKARNMNVNTVKHNAHYIKQEPDSAETESSPSTLTQFPLETEMVSRLQPVSSTDDTSTD